MRAVALWCVALALCSAVLFAGQRSGGFDAVAKGFDGATAVASDTQSGSNALDQQTARPEALQFVGVPAATGGSTVIKAHPSSKSSHLGRTPARPGSASLQSLLRARSSPPLRAIPLLI